MSAEVWLAIALVALTLGSVMAALVQSLRDVSRAKLEDLAVTRNCPASLARVGQILDDLDGHAAAMGLPRTVCNLLFAIAAVMWVTVLRGLKAPDVPELIVGSLLASLMLWVFGVALSTSVARHAAEGTVYTWSWVIRAVYVCGRPLAILASGVDEVVRRLSGRAGVDKAAEVQEEILEAVEDAKVEGTVDAQERDMIEAVVTLRDKTVAQVMTPRTEIEAMELSNDLSAVTATIRSIGHSRIPVYEGSLDHVAGIFYVKDLMKWLAGEGSRTGKPFNLKALLRPALFVPETKTVRELLPELLSKRVHIAMVADEYGGTAGLVTIEDIIEEVFGDIQDEYEIPEEEVPEVKVDPASRRAEIDARAYIRDANDALSPLGVELPESEDYDTVGGFVTVTLGRIPRPGESLRHDGLVVTVLDAEPTRVTRVRVEPGAASAAPAPDESPADRASR